MTHLRLRTLCLVATAIVSLSLATPTEAKDKKKCYTYSCQPVPQCYQRQPVCCEYAPKAVERHCATQFLISLQDPGGELAHIYATGACLHDCNLGSEIALPTYWNPPPGCATGDGSYCDLTTNPNHCVLLNIDEKLGAFTGAAKKGHGHKNLIQRPQLVRDKDQFTFHPNQIAPRHFVNIKGDARVFFEVAGQNAIPVDIVLNLKTFEVLKNPGQQFRANIRMGVELDPAGHTHGEAAQSNLSKARYLPAPTYETTSEYSLVLEHEGASYVVVTNTRLKYPHNQP